MTDQETHDSGLGIFLTGAVARKVNRWRKLYDPYYEKLDPHITLAYPPFIPPAAWEEIRAEISQCLSTFPAFRICLDEVGLFSGSPQVLWLHPRDGGVLLRMRRELEHCFPDLVPPLPFEYQPHVSIGFFPDHDSLLRAKAQVEDAWRPLAFTAREMIYAVQTGEDVWEIRDRIPLLGAEIDRV